MIVDPICTFLFSVLVVFTTIPVAKDCIIILMEGTPVSLKQDLKDLRKQLEAAEGVLDIHDLHVWSLNSNRFAMSAHMISKDPSVSLKQATKICRSFKIYHSTLQIENANENTVYNSEMCRNHQVC